MEMHPSDLDFPLNRGSKNELEFIANHASRTCRKIVKIEAFIEFFQFPKLMKIVKLRNIIYVRTFFFPINKIGLISKPKSILINLEDFTRVGNLIFENSKYSRKTKIFN